MGGAPLPRSEKQIIHADRPSPTLRSTLGSGSGQPVLDEVIASIRRLAGAGSHEVAWPELTLALFDAVAADSVAEVAGHAVAGCREALGARWAAVWQVERGGRPERLAAAGGSAPGRPLATAPVSAGIHCWDVAGQGTRFHGSLPLSGSRGATLVVEGGFAVDDYIGPVRRAALGLLIAAVAGTVSRSMSSENAGRIGRLLQSHLLPGPTTSSSGEVAVRYVPAGEGAAVGGDWYDVVETRDGRTVLVLGDVLGRSVEAAVQMGEVRSALRSHLLEGLPAGLALGRTNELLLGGPGHATCCCVEVSTTGIVVTSAGHLPPITASRSGHATICPTDPGPPLGVVADASYRGQRCDQAAEVIVLYSDGLIHASGTNLDDGIDRLRRAVANADRDDLEKLVTHLLGLARPAGPLRDDIALLAFRPDEPVRPPTQADRAARVPTGRLPLDPELVWRLVDAAPDAMVVTDASGVIVLANQRIESLLGYTRSELIGCSVELLIPEELRGHHAKLRHGYIADPTVRPMGAAALPARRRDGSTLTVEIALSPVQVGGEVFVMSTLRPAAAR